MKTDAGSLLACTPQTAKLFEAKIPGKTAAVHIKVSTYTSQNVVLPGLSCRPHSQTEILTTKTCPLLLTSCAEAMLLPCNGFLSGTMCKAADSDKEGHNSYAVGKTIFKAKQHSNWRQEQLNYNRADPQ